MSQDHVDAAETISAAPVTPRASIEAPAENLTSYQKLQQSEPFLFIQNRAPDQHRGLSPIASLRAGTMSPTDEVELMRLMKSELMKVPGLIDPTETLSDADLMYLYNRLEQFSRREAEFKEKRVRLNETIDNSRQAVEALAFFAIEHDADPQLLQHLHEVWNPREYVIELEEDMRYGVKAFVNRETGAVFVKESSEGDFDLILHESIHRAEAQGRMHNQKKTLQSIFANHFGYTYTPRGLERIAGTIISDQAVSSAEIAVVDKNIDTLASKFKEGLTQWTTERADGMQKQNGESFTVKKGELYQEHVKLFETIKERIQHATSLTSDQIDARFIEAALSGDMSFIIESIGGINQLITLLDPLPVIMPDVF